MKRSWIVPFLFASAVFAQDGSVKTWLPDGTGLEIRTASSGPKAQLSTEGAVLQRPGQDIHRSVVDTQAKVLFAYDIEAKKTAQGTVTLRIKPSQKPSSSEPTLSAIREFPSLRPGDEVQIDILYHPVTNERIYDVVRISDQPPPPKPKPATKRGEQFSLQEVRIMLNGRIILEPGNNWIIGPAAMIHIPSRGRYYLAHAPTPNYPFQAAGWVDHGILRIKMGEDLIEVFGKSNILPKSEYGTVWVYLEPVKTYTSPSGVVMYDANPCGSTRALTTTQPTFTSCPVQIQTADDVESLIPKKKQEEE